MKKHSSDRAPAAIGPYSQAISTGKLIYTSGVIPIVPETGAIAGATIEAQTKQTLKNLSNLLEDNGSSLKKVIKTTVFIKDMRDFKRVNDVYATFFEDPFPARSCVEVARLPKDVKIEIEAIAEKSETRSASSKTAKTAKSDTSAESPVEESGDAAKASKDDKPAKKTTAKKTAKTSVKKTASSKKTTKKAEKEETIEE
jgi:2-iminobutanoate/2-iminopropanoate deaminase